MVTRNNRQYSVDFSLDNLFSQLNPKHFFRVNRQYLISINGVFCVNVFPKSRLKLTLSPPVTDDVFVTVERVVDFKNWLDDNTQII
ncbi:MAG: LytTR family transcriptional regulator [Bacteroidetes bacterium]|nr:LytTR family transcriptional regulator [Bacteroidales bacterium]NJO70371.1 LytTR family transcriptional regulator [Bacteroidota bacterium]